MQASCLKDELCLPVEPDAASAEKVRDKSFMVLVRPREHDSWQPLLAADLTECVVGRPESGCLADEACEAVDADKGVCRCAGGLVRGEEGVCVAKGEESEESGKDEVQGSSLTSSTTTEGPTSPAAPQKITVQASCVFK